MRIEAQGFGTTWVFSIQRDICPGSPWPPFLFRLANEFHHLLRKGFIIIQKLHRSVFLMVASCQRLPGYWLSQAFKLKVRLLGMDPKKAKRKTACSPKIGTFGLKKTTSNTEPNYASQNFNNKKNMSFY